MFAISFDMVVADLKKHYGNPYNNAYYEISTIMEKHGFYWIQGSTYASEESNLLGVTRVMTELKQLNWFAMSVRDIRAFFQGILIVQKISSF